MYSSHHFLYFLASLSGTQWNPLFCIAEQQLLALALFSVLTGGLSLRWFSVLHTFLFEMLRYLTVKYSYTRPVSRLNILHIFNGSYQGLPARIQ